MSWLKEVNNRLIDLFYLNAYAEAERLKERIIEINNLLEDIREHLSFEQIRNTQVNGLKIAAVDGSASMQPALRLGRATSIFAIASVIHTPKEAPKVDVNLYVANRETPNRNVLQYTTKWYMLYAERRRAYELLRQADIVIIDGSLHGYLYGMYKLSRERKMPKWIIELARATTIYTLELIRSGRVLATVKRGKTKSIIPYLYHRGKLDKYYDIIDRSVLTAIQPMNTMLSYTKLYGKPYSYKVFNRLARYYANKVDRSYEAVEEEVIESYEKALKMIGLNIDPMELLNTCDRYVMRPFEPSPIEYEKPVNSVDKLDMLIHNLEIYNPYTNLPIYNDLVDQEAKIPKTLVHKYVEEVESLLIKKYGLDPSIVRALFAPMNPQKEEVE